MTTVAIIGPDGAGKTTITRELVHVLPVPAKHVYMGVNLENSNLVLPTTRLFLEFKRWRGGRPDMAGPTDPARAKPAPKSAVARAVRTAKLSLRIGTLVAEEWFRAAVVAAYERQGNLVLFDRHFFIDYYAHDVMGGPELPLPNRIHGWMLRRLYPRPDLVICLDAPPEVLFARKGEATPELLARRRQEYMGLAAVFPAFVVVDATQPQAHVVEQCAATILEYVRRTGNLPSSHEARGAG